jgi:tetratricopeptide (TPR) repeat protein
VRERLRIVYNATGAGRELAGMVLEDAAEVPTSAAKLPLLLRAGRLLLDAGGEAPRTALVFEEARSLAKAGSPDEQEATVLLAEAYVVAGRIDDARALLDAAVAAHKGRRSKQLSAIHRERARIELGEGDGAAGLAAMQKALECDPQNAALAMELGLLAVDLDDLDVQNRAFRAVTLMKITPAGAADGTSASARGLAYYHLGRVAVAQGDRRKARLMAEKAVADDPALESARALLEQLRAGG